MPRINVVVTDYIENDLDWEKQVLAEEDIGLEAFQLKNELEDEIYESVKSADVIVVNMAKMTASLIERLENCRLIIRHGIGYDNVDVDACTRNNIQFANQPDYCTIDVAEHAITLILASARRLFPAQHTLHDSSVRGEWDFSKLFPLYRMEGKVLGIVGLGRIGRQVARKLSTFGFELIAADPYIDRSLFEEYGVRRVDLDTLLSRSDFVTIHTPLNEETRHLVNEESLRKMKKTAYIINTARGPIVDQEALARALEQQSIAGAAIDVFDEEPPPRSHPLFEQENALLTPHISWASVESSWDIRKSIVDDIMRFASGGNAKHVINSIRLNQSQA